MNTIFSTGMANLWHGCLSVLRRGKGFKRHAVVVYRVNLSGLRGVIPLVRINAAVFSSLVHRIQENLCIFPH